MVSSAVNLVWEEQLTLIRGASTVRRCRPGGGTPSTPSASSGARRNGEFARYAICPVQGTGYSTFFYKMKNTKLKSNTHLQNTFFDLLSCFFERFASKF
jgi:hypothetical protein